MASWHSCNVLSLGVDTRRVWQFDARDSRFKLNREQTARNGESLPANLVGKSWGALFQRKLNVAWLPSEYVFLRVAQFPRSTPDETRAMVELQLEKLSPIPVAQASWTMHILPGSVGATPTPTNPADATPALQTVVLLIVSRDAVEEFLGKLEGQGYMADRLELPMLDQLQATKITGDGAWIYPDVQGGKNTALVAWWYGGVLQNLDLLALQSGPAAAASMKDQFMQVAWAGELEGWLTGPPRWHLVADAATAAHWQPVLREALGQTVETSEPLLAPELAALTAKRAAQEDIKNNLLPAEFAIRYHQQFVDRLWGRGLLAALAIYGIGLAIYFVAVTVFNFQTTKVEKAVKALSGSYTNAVQLKAKLAILKERDQLKFAALDCWDATAQCMPASLTLDTMNFADGKTLSLRGSAPADQVVTVTDFYDKLRKWKNREQPLFKSTGASGPRTTLGPGGTTVGWSFELDLNQTEKQ